MRTMALLLGIGGLIACADSAPESHVRVNGSPLGRDAISAFVHITAEQALSRTVQFTARGAKDKVTFEPIALRDLGIHVDEAEVTRIATIAAQSGDALDVPLRYTLDSTAFLNRIAPWKEAFSVRPENARVLIGSGEILPERPGQFVDVYAAMADVLAAANEETSMLAPLSLPTTTVLPLLTKTAAASIDTSVVLSDFETYFSRAGDQRERAMNIETAAAKLDGLVLTPHDLVSFNSVVGDRSEENGFHRSWEIYKGEMVEGVGGGTCQVATTLHAISFFSGIEILERLPHSRPSAYVPMGLDATVVYPIVDMKLRNPYDFPLVVHAVVQGNKLRMEMHGKTKLVRVTFGREIEENLPYTRKLVEKKELPAGTVRHKQHGIPGYKIKRTRTLKSLNGQERIEEIHDTYPPTVDVYEVPPGFDESKLPPLPDGEGEPLDPSETTADGKPLAAGPVTPVSDGADAGITILGAPGAHTPTVAQKHPVTKISLAR